MSLEMPSFVGERCVTHDVVQCVLPVKGSCIGTAFTIDRGDRQYLVTAGHVAPRFGDRPYHVEIFRGGVWERVGVKVVGAGSGTLDVAVLVPEKPLTPQCRLKASSALYLGQRVSFLGYPYGWDGGGAELSNGYPLPFLKAGVVSAVQAAEASGASGLIGGTPLPDGFYVDAHANPGFSGGPLISGPFGDSRYRVSGVIVDKPSTQQEAETGFVRVVPIDHVLAMIDAHQGKYGRST